MPPLIALHDHAISAISRLAPTARDTRFGDWRRHVVTAADLEKMDFPPASFVVDGLITEGLTILAGRPKIGKSWLALELCLGVASSQQVLGGVKPAVGDVLYCALEDNRRRLHRRINRIWGPDWPARLTLATSWRRLDDGGVEDVKAWCDSVHEPRLIVLDTLAAVCQRGRSGESVYEADYRALENIHAVANEYGLAVVVVHHVRKMAADDPIDTISGSLGLAGCADCALVMTRSSQGTTLYVRGRDVEESEHAVSFSSETCRWSLLGNAADVQRSDSRKQILDALTSSETPLSPDQIAKMTKLKRNNVDQLLSRMVESGEVVKVRRGKYVSSDRAGAHHP